MSQKPTLPPRAVRGRPAAAAPAAASPAPAASAGGRPARRPRDGAASPAAAAPAPAAAPSAAATEARRPARGGATPVAAARKAAPAASAPVPPADKPRDMKTAILKLIEILKLENDALRNSRMDVVGEMVNTKRLLTRAYMEQMAAVRKTPAIVKTLPEEQREVLRQAALELQPLMDENEQLLKGQMDAINKVMGAVVEAVREQRTRSSVVYGGKGAMDGTHSESRGLSVAVNTEL